MKKTVVLCGEYHIDQGPKETIHSFVQNYLDNGGDPKNVKVLFEGEKKNHKPKDDENYDFYKTNLIDYTYYKDQIAVGVTEYNIQLKYEQLLNVIIVPQLESEVRKSFYLYSEYMVDDVLTGKKLFPFSKLLFSWKS